MTKLKLGNCTNRPGACSKAASGEAIPFESRYARCPECGSSLLPILTERTPRKSAASVPKATAKGGRPGLSAGLLGLLALLLGGLAVALYFYLAGSAGSSTATQGQQPLAAAPSTLPPIALASIAPSLRFAGSNTIGASLAPELAQGWLASQGATGIQLHPRIRDGQAVPESDIVGTLGNQLVRIEILAHGSGTAFKALADGSADVGMASRSINDDETRQLGALGDMRSIDNEHVIALDGIAVIVAPGNPLRSLTRPDLARVFSGAITNWSALGGPDQEISVLARDDDSGTWDTFQALVLGKTPLVATAQRFEDSAALEATVARTPGAIGFVGLPYVKTARALAVADSTETQPLSPTVFTVKKEDYPLARRLFLYTASNPANTQVHEFIRFVQSDAGQQIVRKTGFIDQSVSVAAAPAVPLPDATRACTLSSAWQGERNTYCSLTADKTDLGTALRFRTSSSTLDNRAQTDLQRLLRLLGEQPDTQVTLIGFSDASGRYASNVDLSRQRADSVRQSLARLGITNVDVHGFGPELPVADNDTPAGRERNRRVEVWLSR